MTTTTEEVVGTLAVALDGSLGISLGKTGWKFEALDDVSELYVRTNEGTVFRLFAEEVGADEFNPFDED